jgi:hypothetical protein
MIQCRSPNKVTVANRLWSLVNWKFVILSSLVIGHWSFDQRPAFAQIRKGLRTSPLLQDRIAGNPLSKCPAEELDLLCHVVE